MEKNGDDLKRENHIKCYQYEIEAELKKAMIKHPEFPVDAVQQASIMAEEAGEAIRAANQYKWEGGDLFDLRLEYIQTAAMCLRALLTIDEIGPEGFKKESTKKGKQLLQRFA